MNRGDKSGLCMYITVNAGNVQKKNLFVKLSLTFQF